MSATVKAERCMIHRPEIWTIEQVQARINVLQVWPKDLWAGIYEDPRCGCAAPDGVCEADSIAYLEGLL